MNIICLKKIFALFIMSHCLFAVGQVDFGKTTESQQEKSASDTQKIIPLSHNNNIDNKIKKRLQKIYSEFDELKNVNVRVDNGVVSLTGEVTSAEVAHKALEFAKKLEGVTEVQDNIVVNRDLKTRIILLSDKAISLGKDFLAYFPLIVLSVLVVWLFWILGGWLSKRKAIYKRLTSNYFIADLLAKIIHIAFILVGLVIALSLLDATALLGTILGAAGIFGLALGFAVRDTVENFIASLLLSIRKPFDVNDHVVINDAEGKVVRLTSRATILMSFDGNHIRIPNSVVFKSVIVNFTAKSERRFQFDVGVGTDDDLTIAQSLALGALRQIDGVLAEPKPQALVQQLGDSNVVIRIYGWVDQKQHDYLKIRSEAVKAVKRIYDEKEVFMPEPIYRVLITNLDEKQTTTSKATREIAENVGQEIDSTVDQDLSDTKPDRTLDKEINKENAKKEGENLLNPDSPDEL